VPRLGRRRSWSCAALAVGALFALALAGAETVCAQDAPPATPPETPAARPSSTAAGGLLGGVRPRAQSPAERAESLVAEDLAEVAAAPGHEAAEGALAQAREALSRARQRRLSGEAAAAGRALAVGRAAVELAGRQAALERERAAARAAGRARDAAVARASAAREAWLAAQRESARAAEPSAPVENAGAEAGGSP
jgi:hypothetical protein